MLFELRRTFNKPCEELVCRSTRDRLVLLDGAGGEVLPEVASIAPPPDAIWHHAEAGPLVEAFRES